jgi:hypothetical protein
VIVEKLFPYEATLTPNTDPTTTAIIQIFL